jgi:hypothetical protein
LEFALLSAFYTSAFLRWRIRNFELEVVFEQRLEPLTLEFSGFDFTGGLAHLSLSLRVPKESQSFTHYLTGGYIVSLCNTLMHEALEL